MSKQRRPGVGERSGGPAEPQGPSRGHDGLFGLGCSADDAALVVVPVPFDATASCRRGAAAGPATILAASGQVDLLHPRCPTADAAAIAMLAPDAQIESLNTEARAAVDAAREASGEDVALPTERVNLAGAEVNRIVQATVSRDLDRGRIVGLVGGDHATAFGCIAAHCERHPGLGLLQIDAHADLRSAYEGFTWSHASIMDNVLGRTQVGRLVQVGVRDLCATERTRITEDPRLATFFAADLAAQRFRGGSWASRVDAITAALPAAVYVSCDVDGLDPASCPNTGTPVPGGLSFAETIFLFRAVCESGRRIVGFDLTEVAPADGIPLGASYDGNVGARLLFELCCLCLWP